MIASAPKPDVTFFGQPSLETLRTTPPRNGKAEKQIKTSDKSVAEMDFFELARTVPKEEFLRIMEERDRKIEAFLRRYEGSITLTQIADGIEQVVANVEALLSEVTLLRAHRRFARAYSLAVTALEEAGKVVVVHAMSELPAGHCQAWKLAWAEFRSHRQKYSHGAAPTWNDLLYAQMGAHLLRIT